MDGQRFLPEENTWVLSPESSGELNLKFSSGGKLTRLCSDISAAWSREYWWNGPSCPWSFTAGTRLCDAQWGSVAGQRALQLIGYLWIFFVKPLSKFTETSPFRSIHLTKPFGLSHSALFTPHLLAHFEATMLLESRVKGNVSLFDACRTLSILFPLPQMWLATGKRC